MQFHVSFTESCFMEALSILEDTTRGELQAGCCRYREKANFSLPS